MSAAYCLAAPSHPWHGPYHDSEYGFPLSGDAELFERLANYLDHSTNVDALFDISSQNGFIDILRPAASARQGQDGGRGRTQVYARLVLFDAWLYGIVEDSFDGDEDSQF